MRIKFSREARAYERNIENLYKLSGVTGDKNKIILDLGAHVGIFSIRAAEVTDCLVHAYEPHPKNYDTLLHNIKLNSFQDRINVFKEAVWIEDGEAELSLDPYWFSSDSHSMFDMKGWKKATVKTCSPETIFARTDKQKICYLKINCEGGEYYVMRYLVDHEDVLSRVERLCVEIHPDMLRPEWRRDFPEIMNVVKNMNIPYKVMFASVFCKNLDKNLASLKVDNLGVD